MAPVTPGFVEASSSDHLRVMALLGQSQLPEQEEQYINKGITPVHAIHGLAWFLLQPARTGTAAAHMAARSQQRIYGTSIQPQRST
jgi:hypothetical protein